MLDGGGGGDSVPSGDGKPPKDDTYDNWFWGQLRDFSWDNGAKGTADSWLRGSPGLNRFLTRDMFGGALDDMDLTTDPYTGNRYAFRRRQPISFVELDGHLFGMSMSDWGHAALDVAGMVPVIGEAADVANGIWYAAEGNYTDAALSMASAIPGAGNAVTAAKWAKKGAKAVDAVKSGRKAPKAGKTAKAEKAASKTKKAKPKHAQPKGKGKGAKKTCEKGAKKNSFVPGTKVLMADGSMKNIEDLKEGEYVLASDPETSILQARQVTDTITGDGLKHLITLTVDPDGKNGKAKPSTITATANHPFWLPDYGTWAEAGDLEPGMWLQTAAGTWVQITAIDDTHRTQKVHNLTVDGQHTYYVLVGDSPVLVHNAGCPTRLKVPSGDNMAAYKYQRRVTGQETEQVWRLNSGHHAGRRVEVDGDPSNGYITEAKWTGRNSAAWESSPYHPSKFFNEDKVVDQAQRLLDLDAGLGGKGVRYAVSNVEGAAFFRGVLREHFPDEMASGRLAVWHVPGDGM